MFVEELGLPAVLVRRQLEPHDDQSGSSEQQETRDEDATDPEIIDKDRHGHTGENAHHEREEYRRG